MDRPLDQDPRGGGAGLAGILDAGIDEEGQGRVEVGIGEDNLGRFSAELQGDGDGMTGGGGLHQGTGRDRSGEGDMVDAAMGRKRRTGFLAQAGDDIDRPRREAGLLGDAGEGQRGEAGLLRRLQHRGVAHGQRRADTAPDDLHRIVPGDDMARNAMGLA